MAQAQTVDLPKRLPLIVEPENRQEDALKDAKLLNGYVETNTKTKEIWVYKRPGLSQIGDTVAGSPTGGGVYNWLGDIYAVWTDKLYKNGVALAGTIDSTGGVYRFSSCLGATPRLQLGNGVHAYNYDGGAGIVQIDGGGNVNFPTPFCKGWAYLDGTTYAIDSDANVHGCDALNDTTLWTDVLNVLVAQIEPDGGVALGKQLVYVIAFKQWTTEVFYDAQNATGSPLGPVQGAKINYGCVSQDSVQDVDGTLLWIATNRGSSAQVVMLDGLKLKIVSTKPVERLLGEADYSTVYSFALKYEGHRFYVITMKESNLTLAYDLTEDMWAQWTDSAGNYFPIVSSTYSSTTGRVLQHESNGKLYNIDADATTDDGSVITWDLYTPNFDGGTQRRKQNNMLYFIGDQTPGSVVQVRMNDFDYAADKWTNFRSVDMGQKKPFLANNGTYIRRAHHLRHQCATRHRIQAVEMQLDLGTL